MPPLLAMLQWALRRESLGDAVAAGTASLNDLWLLSHVERRGEARLSELASWQRVDKSTVSSQVKAMVERGLLERRPDPSDRRASLVVVSEHGHAEIAESQQRGRAHLDGVLAQWSPGDRRDLACLLARLVADAEAWDARVEHKRPTA